MAAFSDWACSMACPTISTVMGWMSPSMDTAKTRGGPCPNADTAASTPNKQSIRKHIYSSFFPALFKPGAADQVHKSRIAANRIEEWMYFEGEHNIRLLLIGLLEPSE